MAKRAVKKGRAPSPVQTAAHCPVVGIGASAGGLEAFTRLLRGVPAPSGVAFVLIQHLDPKHISVLTELLGRETRMPVMEVKEGTLVRPEHVYVIPKNTNMAMADGRLTLTPREKDRNRHMPVDYFFRSLAEARKDKAMGVILAGTGSDGTMGCQAIKAAGGLTFAQDPETAAYDGMP